MACRTRRASGASLLEALVATGLLLIVCLGLWRALSQGVRAHDTAEDLADLHQSIRQGLRDMADEVRRAGFDHARDPGPRGLRESGEPIEHMGRHSILLRANLDSREGTIDGREPVLESSTQGGCCAEITVGNDEIVGWALGKDDGDPTSPRGTLRAVLDLQAPRRGRVLKDGRIDSEAMITIDGIVGDDEIPDAPPYVLTRLSFSASGMVVRQPVADGLMGMDLRYFDAAGRELDPVGGLQATADADAAERLRRAAVRRVTITLRGMTSDPDLALARAQGPGASAVPGHRELELREEVPTPDVAAPPSREPAAPEPVDAVRCCAGQCGAVRVSWRRSPSHGAIACHVVTLARCPSGPESADFSHPVTTVVAAPLRDAHGEPDREAAVLSGLESKDLDGVRVCARVVARATDGTESMPADSKQAVVVSHFVRSEAPTLGRATGFDPGSSAWPVVEPDATAGAPVVLAAEHESYPRGHRIEVSFAPPRFGLNRRPGILVPPWDWTTRQDRSGIVPALDCHAVKPPEAGGAQQLRTPLLGLGAAGGGPNVYLFRVSGSDPWSWGPDQHRSESRVKHPCRFVPFAGNLLAFVALPLSAERATFIDDCAVTFEGSTDGGSQYDQRFVSVGVHDVHPAGGPAPPRAVAPGEVFYYRVRVTDRCWHDEDRDGIHDAFATSDHPLAAWSTAKDFDGEAAWRKAAACLSPFYPPLSADPSPGHGDLPEPQGDDSDSGSAEAGCALPGLAIPPLVDGDRHAIPERPTELSLARRGEADESLLPSRLDPGSGSQRRGTRIVFNAARRTAPEDMSPPSDAAPVAAAHAWYRLCRRLVDLEEASDPPTRPTAAELDFEPGDSGVEAVTELRLRHPEGWRALTIDRASEVQGGMGAAPTNPALFLPWAEVPPGHSFAYRLFAVQVATADPRPGAPAADEARRVEQDGITPDWARWSRGSPPLIFPCPLQQRVRHVEVVLEPTPYGTSAVEARVELVPPATCEDVKAARILVHALPSGDFVGSSRWIPAGPGPCLITAAPSVLSAALRGHAGAARIAVEISSSPDDVGRGPMDVSNGCRVRSDLPGDGAEPGAASSGAVNLPPKPAEAGP